MKNLSRFSKVLASAHDAGGANQLIFLLSKYENVDFLLTGPAAEIGNAFLEISRVNEKFITIKEYECVIVSSNSQPRLSDRLLTEAQGSSIPTIGILDHWVNYKSRWKIAPDTIIATDFYAFLVGTLIFGWKTRYRRSEYLRRSVEAVNSNKVISGSILVLLQPVDAIYDHSINVCICSHMAGIITKLKPNEVVIREHHLTKAEQCLLNLRSLYIDTKFRLSIPMEPLYKDLSRANSVLGFDTYALFVSKKANKNTFSLATKRRKFLGPRYRKI